jgi:hypothetical protein
MLYWREQAITVTPNDTIPAYVWSVTGVAINIDAVIEAKGSGSHLAAIPDSSIVGGNKRGDYSTDWQKSRAAATQVASGDYAVIAGGLNNTAASNYSVVPGGAGATTRALVGAMSFSSFFDTTEGRAQTTSAVLRAYTTTNAATVVTTDGLAQSATNVFVLPDNSTYFFQAMISARNTGANGESHAWILQGAIRKDNGTTSLVGVVTSTEWTDTAVATWTAAATADNTNSCLIVTVTGENAKNIRWVCKIITIEVTNA